ncbi:hypothetical protein CQS04_03810 [Chryseomicrobium excrementi]|uniref:Spo0E family sporulation regulatory protein-aspartic acid phosphatase n=1 Tax=Chryseomicrobium excrementi TaxID=2041346 RepID=A0A2M9F3J6_9BACL|nr:aspartyl-phosphate phosphatase Spo0E family protein [Chryseomicrobium excrementi]PJK18014.1 hypothetical protein CQS04_03810 [Chryseomicrobium excrementi]
MTNTLLNQLEQVRQDMIQCASEKGLTDESTIRLSEELDQLINQYYKEFKKNK